MTYAINSGAEPGISLDTLRAWIGWQIDKWESWSAEQPNADWLAIETGNAGFPTVSRLLLHAFGPIRRYAERTIGLEPFDDSAVNHQDFTVLAAFARECLQVHENASASLDIVTAREEREIQTRSAGVWTITAEEALVHSLTHCFWHLGGIAQLLRAKGIAPVQWSDLIFFCVDQREQSN